VAKIIDITTHTDYRGNLSKIFTKKLLDKLNFGLAEESYTITFNKKNIIRGSHYHNHTNEIFFVMLGECRFDVYENNQIRSFTLNEDSSSVIFIEKSIPHQIVSISRKAIVIAISSKQYDPQNDDTYNFIFQNH